MDWIWGCSQIFRTFFAPLRIYEPDEPDVLQKVAYSAMRFICADVRVTRLAFLSLFNFLFLCISLHFVINPVADPGGPRGPWPPLAL